MAQCIDTKTEDDILYWLENLRDHYANEADDAEDEDWVKTYEKYIADLDVLINTLTDAAR